MRVSSVTSSEVSQNHLPSLLQEQAWTRASGTLPRVAPTTTTPTSTAPRQGRLPDPRTLTPASSLVRLPVQSDWWPNPQATIKTEYQSTACARTPPERSTPPATPAPAPPAQTQWPTWAAPTPGSELPLQTTPIKRSVASKLLYCSLTQGVHRSTSHFHLC